MLTIIIFNHVNYFSDLSSSLPSGEPASQKHTGQICPFFYQLFLFSKLLVVVFGPVSVEELVSVENTPSACLWF